MTEETPQVEPAPEKKTLKWFCRITIRIPKSSTNDEVHMIPLGSKRDIKNLQGPQIDNHVIYQLQRKGFAEKKTFLEENPSVGRHITWEIVSE